MTYSTKTRLAAAKAVLEAKTYDDQKKALDHWGVFLSGSLPPWSNDIEIEYLEKAFEILRWEVTIWYMSYLEERIETLENPNGGRPGDHR